MNILGVDIGGTAVKLGIVDEAGNVLAREEHSVCFDGYRTSVLDTALVTARGFLERSGARIAGVGVSATGQIDAASGCVIGTCGNLPGWVRAPIRAAFEDVLKRPTHVMNDADCALLGEAWVGGARGFRNVVMVTLGTGVGGGAMVDGRILQGRAGLAGEIGHMPLRHGGQPCTCGSAGCYEQYASVTALLRGAQTALREPPQDAKALFERASGDDAEVLQLLDTWRDDIAAGLIGLTHLFNPELILLGGGVCRQDALLVRPVRELVLSRAMPRFAQELRIEAATLGNDAGMIGAARRWLDESALSHQ